MSEELNTAVNLKQLLGLDKVAKLLDVSKREVQRLIATQELPKPIKIGRLSKLTVGEVEAFIEKLKQRRNSKEKIVE
jgi:excisionase family DNA binding protein